MLLFMLTVDEVFVVVVVVLVVLVVEIGLVLVVGVKDEDEGGAGETEGEDGVVAFFTIAAEEIETGVGEGTVVLDVELTGLEVVVEAELEDGADVDDEVEDVPSANTGVGVTA